MRVTLNVSEAQTREERLQEVADNLEQWKYMLEELIEEYDDWDDDASTVLSDALYNLEVACDSISDVVNAE